jgi:hypothetical protein
MAIQDKRNESHPHEDLDKFVKDKTPMDNFEQQRQPLGAVSSCVWPDQDKNIFPLEIKVKPLSIHILRAQDN